MESVATSGRTVSAKALAGLVVGLVVSGASLWLAVRNADLDLVLRARDGGRVRPRGGRRALRRVRALAARWHRIADTPSLGWRRFYGMARAGSPATTSSRADRELLRARWLSTDADARRTRAGTIALDRACDVATLALFLAVGLNVVASPGWLVRMAVGAAVLVVLIAAALVFARQYATRRPRDRRARGRVRRIVRDTIEMLAEPIGRRHAATWMALSIATWSLGTIAVVLVARSVGSTSPRSRPSSSPRRSPSESRSRSSPGYVGRTSGSASPRSGSSTSR